MDTAYKRTVALVEEHRHLIEGMTAELLTDEVRVVGAVKGQAKKSCV